MALVLTHPPSFETRRGVTTVTRGRLQIIYDRRAVESRRWDVYFDGKLVAGQVTMDDAHWALLTSGVTTMPDAVDLLNAAMGCQNARRRLKRQSGGQ
ncbi:hypothetical protein CDO52_08060 [Nocardiopsis gilva YIM 90087]|uniref:Uncharacterized protein n=1 Tax=Nocardiopsis gilva YIM 90087 TaxID=1235441 RepID=A0A223S3N5_9ACTN|nr:hypothetical protein CDO52_08060 [Nocardiopsis gilva YIM 90087]